nr:hypothetical protein [Tanacetum cinerariifolium]
TTHRNHSSPEYEAFSFYDDHIEEIRSGSTTTEEFVDEPAHIISPPEYDCFHFRDLPNSGEFISSLNSGIRENLSSTTCVNLPVEDDYSPLLAYVVWIFLAYLTSTIVLCVGCEEPLYGFQFVDGGNFNGMSIEINKKKKLQLLEHVANLSTYPSQHFNSFCYDDDDDEEATIQVREYYKNSHVAITPDFSITDSLIMEDEHHSSIISSPKIDSLLEEFSDKLAHIDLISLRINETDFDPEEEICLVKRLFNDSSSLLKNESFHFDIPSSLRPPAKPSNDDEIEPDTGILSAKVVDDIFELYVLKPSILPTQPTLASNEKKSPHLLSHRGFKAFQLFSESPTMIYGGNIPNLDVPFLYLYPP